MKLVGPFTQILTMDGLPVKGAIQDSQLQIIKNGGILHNDGHILETGVYSEMAASLERSQIQELEGDLVCMPGLIDMHTHIAWAGSRAGDYALRLSGKSYQEIAAEGGGIWNTVLATRKASLEELTELILKRAEKAFRQGVTTLEVKSGYGLSVDEELKILNSILLANSSSHASLVPTCLAAHIKPKDFCGNERDWLEHVVEFIFPELESLDIRRVDIFVEEGAFSIQDARFFLDMANRLGYSIAMHGDQFSSGSVSLCKDFSVLSIDHLEAITDRDMNVLSNLNTFPVVLPGASLGLGISFAPARKLLDKGCSLVLASDWNPGSAPMGDLLTQSALIGASEKLSVSEVLSAITFRAALALGVPDRGILRKGMLADMIAFPVGDYREILYQQGSLKPSKIWKKGKLF